jgi:DNA replication protein DnaC
LPRTSGSRRWLPLKRNPLRLRGHGLVGEFSTPFDEFEPPSRSALALRRGILPYWVQAGLRGLSFGALWAAILTACFLMVQHALPLIVGPQVRFSLKSAFPLISIGISYFILILTLRRSIGQRLVGLSVGLAFVLWGLEQFLNDQAAVAFIDDVVVFLFVVDLSIVIRHNLARCAGEGHVRQAGFPVAKTIESFNFGAQSSVDEGLVRTLLLGKYIERRENVVIVGKSGTGKTHLATALGYAACFQRKRVMFITASALVSELIDHHERRRLRRFYRRLDRLDLLIVDEIGYGRFSELGRQLLFEALRAGYERISLVITTTVSPDKWREAFGGEYLAQAAADRLTDRGHLLEATGEPYWKPGRKAVGSPQFRVQDA